MADRGQISGGQVEGPLVMDNAVDMAAATAAKMKSRRPDMFGAVVNGRGHIPFLDEPEAVARVTAWLERARETQS